MRTLVILLLLAGPVQADSLGCLYEQPGHGVLSEDGECLRAHRQASRSTHYLDDSPLQQRYRPIALLDPLQRLSAATPSAVPSRPTAGCGHHCTTRLLAEAGHPSHW